MYIFLDESYNLKDRSRPQFISISGFKTAAIKQIWKHWKIYRRKFISKARIHNIHIRGGYYGDPSLPFYSTNNTLIDNYCRGDAYYEMISVAGENYLLDQNDVKSDYGDTEYRIDYGPGTVRNAIGTTYKVSSANGASVTVEYTNGRTFSVDGEGKYTTYTFSSGGHAIDVFGGDTTPPTASNGQPTGTITDNTPTLSVTSNEPATCKGSIDIDETYENMDFTFTGTGISHSYDVITSLSDGSHIVYVRCKDTANNIATSSYSWSFTVETPTLDTTPPSAVTNPSTSNPASNSIKLTWTAPGDDGNSGTASQYDIRYSTSEITEANWNSATQCTGEPIPQIAGSTETFTVTGLSSTTTYYFALKTSDEVPNWYEISNSPSGTTLEPTGDLVGCWKMDDNAANTTVIDETGVNNGTFNDADGNPNTDAHSVAGKMGDALDFDGTDDYVDVGTGIPDWNNEPRTIAAWILPTGAAAYRGIVGSSSVTSQGTSFYLREAEGENVGFQINNAGTRRYLFTGDIGWGSGEWKHVAVIWDGSLMHVYINGIDSSGAGTTSSSSHSFSTWKIGRTADYYFNGTIDEVRIYNRALSATQIQQFYTFLVYQGIDNEIIFNFQSIFNDSIFKK